MPALEEGSGVSASSCSPGQVSCRGGKGPSLPCCDWASSLLPRTQVGKGTCPCASLEENGQNAWNWGTGSSGSGCLRQTASARDREQFSHVAGLCAARAVLSAAGDELWSAPSVPQQVLRQYGRASAHLRLVEQGLQGFALHRGLPPARPPPFWQQVDADVGVSPAAGAWCQVSVEGERGSWLSDTATTAVGGSGSAFGLRWAGGTQSRCQRRGTLGF